MVQCSEPAHPPPSPGAISVLYPRRQQMKHSGGKLTCDVCGAILAIPTDVAILSVTCAHCQHAQVLPDADRRRKEQREAQDRQNRERERHRAAEAHADAVRSSSRMGTWITLASFGFAIVIAAVAAGPGLLQAWSAIEQVSGLAGLTSPTPIPVTAPPLPAPVPIAIAPITPLQSPAVLAETARTRVAAKMRERMAAGCRRVILPPEIVTGPKAMTAELVRGRQCIEILAIAGAPTNPLTLTMATPFGEAIPPPPPGAEIGFRHCAAVAGPHPVHVTPASNDPYALAALECPRVRKARFRGRR
jgi:hypothetical protein